MKFTRIKYIENRNGLLLFLLFFASLAPAQKNVTGTWDGKLSVATTSLRVVIHLKGEAGAYTATMDSPDQGAIGIPVKTAVITGDSVYLDVAAVGGKLAGVFRSDSSLDGSWLQGGSIPIHLNKRAPGENPSAAKRPQTPTPPFPYTSKDVVYFNKDQSVKYGGTLTIPQGNGPFPALILITGSGQQNRDEEMFDHKPFAVIADYLTRKGYLVLRVDDRGIGQTTGDVATATSRTFADDAEVGLDYLKTLPQVDKNKLGLLGHSEGGQIAELIAAERSDVAFVVLLAAPGRPVIDLMAEQNKAILQSMNISAEAANQYAALYQPLLTAMTFAETDSLALAAANRLVSQWREKTPANVVASTTGITSNASQQLFIREFMRTVRTPWFRYFLSYNPDNYVRKIKAKVLALNGTKDAQVAANSNLAALKASLQKSGSKKYDLLALPGLNHFFQHCQQCTVQEYGQLEETIAPEVLQTIGDWLDKNGK